MAEYSENRGNEKSNGKDRDSRNQSNREMDYFGENPEKLDKILADNTKDRKTEQKFDYFGENPEKSDKILSLSHKEKLKDTKLNDPTKEPTNFITLRKS